MRVSLGGVRDEAEIRGHRRTYIGALPGKIIQSMRKAGSGNPVMLLDEVDKMSTDFRGDPSSALLEVLDPEQNYTFNDHYLDCDYDLSKVMFITTANTLDRIPRPLQDRMEIIRIPGYTETEKLQIAKRYLVTKQREANGLKERTSSSPTRRCSGSSAATRVRRACATSSARSPPICRKVAVEVVKTDRNAHVKVSASSLAKYLGPPTFRYGIAETEPQIGVATGLAWTEMGGELLSVEVTIVPGRGKLTDDRSAWRRDAGIGAGGDVVRALARRHARARSELLPQDRHPHSHSRRRDSQGRPLGRYHAGDGAGLGATRDPVRNDLAMTGEITLRGRVLPIGGLKEKVLAAHRGGIKTILIPKENGKDIEEIPPAILKGIRSSRSSTWTTCCATPWCWRIRRRFSSRDRRDRSGFPERTGDQSADRRRRGRLDGLADEPLVNRGREGNWSARGFPR